MRPHWLERLRRDVRLRMAAAIAARAHQRAVLAHARDMLDMSDAELRRIRRDLAALEAKVRRHPG